MHGIIAQFKSSLRFCSGIVRQKVLSLDDRTVGFELSDPRFVKSVVSHRLHTVSAFLVTVPQIEASRRDFNPLIFEQIGKLTRRRVDRSTPPFLEKFRRDLIFDQWVSFDDHLTALRLLLQILWTVPLEEVDGQTHLTSAL